MKKPKPAETTDETDLENIANSSPKANGDSNEKKKIRYTPEEDKLILDYVTEHPGAALSSTNFWQQMEKDQILPNKSAGSLKARYNSHLREGVKKKSKKKDSESSETTETTSTEKHNNAEKKKHIDGQELTLSQLSNTIEKLKLNENTDSAIPMVITLGLKMFEIIDKLVTKQREPTRVADSLVPHTPTSDKKNKKRKKPEDSPESKENADKEKSKPKKPKTDQPSTESNSTTNNNNSNKTTDTTINSEKTSGELKKKKHKEIKPAETTPAVTESS